MGLFSLGKNKSKQNTQQQTPLSVYDKTNNDQSYINNKEDISGNNQSDITATSLSQKIAEQNIIAKNSPPKIYSQNITNTPSSTRENISIDPDKEVISELINKSIQSLKSDQPIAPSYTETEKYVDIEGIELPEVTSIPLSTYDDELQDQIQEIEVSSIRDNEANAAQSALSEKISDRPFFGDNILGVNNNVAVGAKNTITFDKETDTTSKSSSNIDLSEKNRKEEEERRRKQSKYIPIPNQQGNETPADIDKDSKSHKMTELTQPENSTDVVINKNDTAQIKIGALDTTQELNVDTDADQDSGLIKQSAGIQMQRLAQSLNPETKSNISRAATKQIPYQTTNSDGELSKRDPNEIKLENLRTYEDDIKFAVRNQNMTRARMLMAEQKQKEDNKEIRESASIKKPINKIFLLLAILLILGGISTVIYFFFFAQKNPSEIIRPRLEIIKPTFIDVDLSREIVFSGRLRKNINDEVNAVIETPMEQGKIREILFTKEIGEVNNKQKVTISSQEFIKYLETNAPENLIRSFDKDFMFGLFSETDTDNQPFLLFKVNDFQNAFAGMLEWENYIAKDLSLIFKQFDDSIVFKSPENKNNEIDNETLVTTSTSTASSTISDTTASTTPDTYDISINTDILISTSTPDLTLLDSGTSTDNATINNNELEIKIDKNIPSFDPKKFIDRVVLNRDTRAIINKETGFVMFMYSFIDEKNLVIVNNNKTLNEILVRMRSAQLIR